MHQAEMAQGSIPSAVQKQKSKPGWPATFSEHLLAFLEAGEGTT